MFEVDPTGKARQVLPEDSAKRSLREHLKRDEPGMYIARRLFRKGGWLFAPLYFAVIVFACASAIRFASWAVDSSSLWWFAIWLGGTVAVLLCFGCPLFWLDQKLYTEASDES